MKVSNLAVLNVLTTLLERSGEHAGVLYTGAAKDQEGNFFLIKENSYPVGFSVDNEGEVVLNSTRHKGATKFHSNTEQSVKECVTEYAKKNKLNNEMCFILPSIEKAMVLATFGNLRRNLEKNPEAANNSEEFLNQVATEVTGEILTATAKVMESDPGFQDDDGLVAAMIAAGMTPVKDGVEVQPQPNIRKVTETHARTEEPVSKPRKKESLDEELSRSERLIDLMKASGDLSQTETDMLNHLEKIVNHKRERQARLERDRNDHSTPFAAARAMLLSGPITSLGLHRMYVA